MEADRTPVLLTCHRRASPAGVEPQGSRGRGAEEAAGVPSSRRDPALCASARLRRGAQLPGPRPPASAPGGAHRGAGQTNTISVHSSRRTQARADTLVVWFPAESEDQGHGVGGKSRRKAPAPGSVPGAPAGGGLGTRRGRGGRSGLGDVPVQCRDAGGRGEGLRVHHPFHPQL